MFVIILEIKWNSECATSYELLYFKFWFIESINNNNSCESAKASENTLLFNFVSIWMYSSFFCILLSFIYLTKHMYNTISVVVLFGHTKQSDVF